jgi:hypothetical protein
LVKRRNVDNYLFNGWRIVIYLKLKEIPVILDKRSFEWYTFSENSMSIILKSWKSESGKFLLRRYIFYSFYTYTINFRLQILLWSLAWIKLYLYLIFLLSYWRRFSDVCFREICVGRKLTFFIRNLITFSQKKVLESSIMKQFYLNFKWLWTKYL